MTNSDINERLAFLSSTQYKKFNENIAASSSPILGVTIPNLRALSKEIAKDTGDYLERAELDNYEKIMLYGLVLANAKLPLDKTFLYLDPIIKRFDSWAHVDIIIAEFKAFKKDRNKVLEHFMKYKNAESELEKRAFVVLLLDYFLTDDYIDNTITLLKTVPHGQYYTDMAVAWTVSVGLVKYYDKFLRLLTDNIFSVFVHNKSISKAIDSFRITKEQKQFLRTLKQPLTNSRIF